MAPSSGSSLGGVDGSSDEFGTPDGPSTIVDASIGCFLGDVPGRLGEDVQQVTLTHPVLAWNSSWENLELRLAVAR